jgi:hypothetical protein
MIVSKRRWLWVPAFAGTTIANNLYPPIDRVRQLICPTGAIRSSIVVRHKNFSLNKPAPNKQIVEPIQQIYPTGKSPKSSSSLFRKNILIFRSRKLSYIDCIPFHSEGRFANVTNVGMGCGGRGGTRDGRVCCVR